MLGLRHHRRTVVVLLALALAGAATVVVERGSARPGPLGCVAQVFASPYAPPAGASTTALGPQPAAYELRAPARARPRGVVLLIHGGGWSAVGPAQLGVMRGEESFWLAHGWATANVDYRACERGPGDVLGLHDAVRRRIGPRTPLVVEGQSAGAQLGLLLAAARPASVAAVVAEAPPTDPVTFGSQRVFDPADGRLDAPSPRWIALAWRAVFGTRWTTVGSPVHQAPRIRARVVLAHGRDDRLVPAGQISEMARALRRSRPGRWLRVLPDLAPGAEPFPHAAISDIARRTLDHARTELVAPWELGPALSPARVPGWWTRRPDLP